MNKKISLSLVVLSIIILSGCTLPNLNKTVDIGPEAAKAKATEFVKNNLVQEGTAVSTKEVTKEGDLYKIVFTVGKQEITAYMTADGKKFFPQVMDIAETEKQAEAQKKKDEAAAKDVPKTDKPTVDLYVMAFCPFGNKAEDTIKPAYALLKNKVDFNFHYIVNSDGNTISSLHGQKEVDQDMREACVLKNYSKDKWMDFVTYINDNCGSDGSCWESGAKSLALDTAKINACVSTDGVALMKADEEISGNAGANGSPTLVVNGVETKAVYQYGNSEAYKQAICAAFNTAPEECLQALSSETSTTQGGSCN